MRPARELDSGILPTFRLLTGVQLVITGLGLITQRLGTFSSRPPQITLTTLTLLEPGVLFLYLMTPGLRRSFRSSYLPIGVIWAMAGLLVEPYIAGAISQRELATWLWRQTLFLSIPLVVVGWRYSTRLVLWFCVITAVLNITFLSLSAGYQELVSSSLLAIVFIQLVLYLLIGVLVVKIMQTQRGQWQRLIEANERLAQYASTLEQLTISRERNRLARELHDVLAHTLSGVAVELEGLRSMMNRDPERAQALLNNSLQAIREGLVETRRALQELRAKPLEDLGLALAVRALAESYVGRVDFHIDLNIDQDLGDYLIEVQHCVYRITQEALANVTEHAQAQNVQVILRQARDQLKLVICDDGSGFNSDIPVEEYQFGLLGMRERAEMVGGSLSVESQLGKGTQISFSYGGANDGSAI